MLDGSGAPRRGREASARRHRPRNRGDRHRDPGRARKRRLARGAVGQGGAADYEPRRHPRLRGARARPSHVPLSLRRKPRRGDRRRRARSACRASSSRSCRARARARAPRKTPRRSAPRGTMRSPKCAATGPRVIVEELIEFDSEITLLTVATKDGILFCPPVGHRQEAGDYRESWQPAAIPNERAAFCAPPVAQGGRGARRPRHFRRRVLRSRRPGDLFRASPRPHDTGMVTLISQFPNEFELHLRAVLGLPIPSIEFAGPSASAVILASEESDSFAYEGWPRRSRSARRASRSTCASSPSPTRLTNRRMGVALARGDDAEDAVARAKAAAARVQIRYDS